MEHLKQFFADERPDRFNTIGVSETRSDANGHVTGRTQFYADRAVAMFADHGRGYLCHGGSIVESTGETVLATKAIV